MAPYACPNCTRLLHFEARVCPQCHFTLGYDPEADAFLFLGDNLTKWRDAGGTPHEMIVCANNNQYEVCNWLVSPGDDTPYCFACRHNRTIPDLTIPTVPQRWGKIEAAKRRLFQELIRLKLPLETIPEAAASGRRGLVFDFLYDVSAENMGKPQVFTGHDGGVITLNIIEADDAQRERIRASLNEPYRTLLGHFRHEIGHYYWETLIKDDPEALIRCRAIFGDDTIDYAESMKRHYGSEGDMSWTAQYVSAYATMHPWEDFAETFAHYLHIVDALATLRGFEMKMAREPLDEGRTAEATVDFSPYRADAARLIEEWVPFSFAENAINRSMGQPDLYPFHLTQPIIDKIDYVGGIVHKARGARGDKHEQQVRAEAA